MLMVNLLTDDPQLSKPGKWTYLRSLSLTPTNEDLGEKVKDRHRIKRLGTLNRKNL